MNNPPSWNHSEPEDAAGLPPVYPSSHEGAAAQNVPPPMPGAGDGVSHEVPPVVGGWPPPQLPKPARPGILELVIGLAIIWGFDLAIGGVAALLAILVKGGPPSGISLDLGLGPAAVLIISLLSGAGTLAVSWFMMCRKFKRSFFEGLALKKIGVGTLAVSVVIGLVGAIVATVLMAFFSTGESAMAKLASTSFGLAVIVVIALLLPFSEEIYYRGFLLPILQRYLGGWAVGLVALWFVAAHVPQLIGDWMGIPVIFVMGLIWTWQRYKTGSLVPGIVTHWVYNFVQVVIALFAKTLQS